MQLVTEYNMDGVQIQDSKLKIAMKLDRVPNSFGRPQGLGSVVSTTRFMQYGKVVARIKTGSSSPGVVSAFILRNEEPGDEIDFEIVGRDPTEAQTNFYYRTPPYTTSDLVDYSNAGKTPLGLNTALDFHDYEIEWLPDYISWKIDGRVVRSVFRNQTKDDELVVDPATGLKAKKFPSTPARIQFGIWDGGQGSNGTAAWAGTPTDWSKPDQTYEIQIDYVDIQCCKFLVVGIAGIVICCFYCDLKIGCVNLFSLILSPSFFFTVTICFHPRLICLLVRLRREHDSDVATGRIWADQSTQGTVYHSRPGRYGRRRG